MAQSDTMAAEGTLDQLWESGREGSLSPLQQVRAIAPRDVYTELDAIPTSGARAALNSAIAERVTKLGGGHPSREATRSLLERYDADPGNGAQAPDGPLGRQAPNSLSTSLKNILPNLNDELRNELRTSHARVSQRVTLLRFVYILYTICYKWGV